MTRLYIPERAQPFPATKTEVGGLLCEVPKRWIESFRATLERQLDGIFDGTPPSGLVYHMPVRHFFEKCLHRINIGGREDRSLFVSVVGAPRCNYMLNPLEPVLRERSRFFDSRNLSGCHIGLLVVTEVSFSEPDLTAIPPLAMGSPVSGPGPNHAIELGIRYGFHVLQSTEADLCSDFTAALKRLRIPSSQSGWVNLS